MSIKLNDKYLQRKAKYFPNVSVDDWNNWKWQVRNRIMTVEKLSEYINLSKEEKEAIKQVLSKFRMSITPYFLCLIDPDDP
ncbi:MAG: lysine 2,3-aminomutase, partial [Bacilli bacterium]